MKRPSKKDIKAALDQIKGATHDENGKPLHNNEKGAHLSPKMSNRRIGQKKV